MFDMQFKQTAEKGLLEWYTVQPDDRRGREVFLFLIVADTTSCLRIRHSPPRTMQRSRMLWVHGSSRVVPKAQV